MTGTSRATLDRIVDGEHAVLLVEGESGDVVDEVVRAVSSLPAAGRHEGARFAVGVDDDGTLTDLTYLPDETEQRRDAAQERLDRLSSPLDERDETGE